jgi:PKHD-type hydroxylase
MLLHIPDVLTPEALQAIQQALSGADWQDGRRTAGNLAIHAKQNEQLAPDAPEALLARQLILQALDRHPLFFSATLPARIFPPQFNRYGGQHNVYGDHVDGAVMHSATTGQRVRSDVSCTVFLADPADYDGGELVVNHSYGQQAIKLPAGHAVIYPSASVHRVEPVTRGHRLASFFWVQSMVRSDEQRRLLFDLDMNLMHLREAHGQSDSDQEAVVGLTGTYHNLLRMWADT